MTYVSIVQRLSRGLVALACVASSASCAGDLARTGRSPVFLIVDNISAASGADAGTFSSLLNSDVLTLVEQTVNGVVVRVPTIFNDTGRATLRIALKNPGTIAVPTTPTTINEVTITRYRVDFKRTDGRNERGVDVPYGFDGGTTVTVGAQGVVVGFDMVRHTMKSEPPLRNLINAGGLRQINTLAEITFYGRDQAGNEISVTAVISVNFADFGDPA